MGERDECYADDPPIVLDPDYAERLAGATLEAAEEWLSTACGVASKKGNRHIQRFEIRCKLGSLSRAIFELLIPRGGVGHRRTR